MALAQHATPVSPRQPMTSAVQSHQSPQALPGSDPGPAINASESNLGDYLNQPVQSVLARLGRAAIAPSNGSAGSGGSPCSARGRSEQRHDEHVDQSVDPDDPACDRSARHAWSGIVQQPRPHADAWWYFPGYGLGGSKVQPAMAGLDGVWQGTASSAASAKTTAALANGTQVASQSTALQNSLSAAAASVQQAQAQLVAILNEFSATIAAIRPQHHLSVGYGPSYRGSEPGGHDVHGGHDRIAGHTDHRSG